MSINNNQSGGSKGSSYLMTSCVTGRRDPRERNNQQLCGVCAHNFKKKNQFFFPENSEPLTCWRAAVVVAGIDQLVLPFVSSLLLPLYVILSYSDNMYFIFVQHNQNLYSLTKSGLAWRSASHLVL